MWKATKQVYTWITQNYDGAYQEGMRNVKDEDVQVAWNFCETTGDGLASANDITECSIRMADWADMSDYTRDYMYKFGQKYWLVSLIWAKIIELGTSSTWMVTDH